MPEHTFKTCSACGQHLVAAPSGALMCPTDLKWAGGGPFAFKVGGVRVTVGSGHDAKRFTDYITNCGGRWTHA